MAKILITGVNGFIGSHVADRLARGHELLGLDRQEAPRPGLPSPYVRMSLPDPGLAEVVASFAPDWCIHCAGGAEVGFSLANPARDFDMGPYATLHLLEALRTARPGCVLVFCSSAAVYGNPDRLPVSEDAPCAPISPYGFHKLVCETVLKEYRQIYGVPSVVLRIFSCYGAGLRKQLLWDVAEKYRAGRLEFFGTGEETRDFIHVRDVAEAFARIVEAEVRNCTLNLASGAETTIRRLITSLVAELGGPAQEVRFAMDVRAGDPRFWRADITRAAALGITPTVPLELGIAEYARWHQDLHTSTPEGTRP